MIGDRSTLPQRERLTSTTINGTIHARYRTGDRTLCGKDAPRHEPNHWLPDCGTCARVARAFDRIDGSMPDHWRPNAKAAA